MNDGDFYPEMIQGIQEFYDYSLSNHADNATNICDAVNFIAKKLKNESNKNKPSIDLNFIIKLHQITTCLATPSGFCPRGVLRMPPTHWIGNLDLPAPTFIDGPPQDEIYDLMKNLVTIYGAGSVTPEQFFMYYLFIFPFAHETVTVGKLLLCYLKNSVILYDQIFENELIGIHHTFRFHLMCNQSHWLVHTIDMCDYGNNIKLVDELTKLIEERTLTVIV